MLKTRVKRGAREMWHGMHSLFPPESQSLCESRADSIGFTGAKLITGSSPSSPGAGAPKGVGAGSGAGAAAAAEPGTCLLYTSCGKNCGLLPAILEKKPLFFSCQLRPVSDSQGNPLYINTNLKNAPVLQTGILVSNSRHRFCEVSTAPHEQQVT